MIQKQILKNGVWEIGAPTNPRWLLYLVVTPKDKVTNHGFTAWIAAQWTEFRKGAKEKENQDEFDEWLVDHIRNICSPGPPE